MKTKTTTCLFSTPIWRVSELIGLPSLSSTHTKFRTILHNAYRSVIVFSYAISLIIALNHDATLTFGRIPLICNIGNYLKLYIGITNIVCSHVQLFGNHFKSVTQNKMGEHFLSIDKQFSSVFKCDSKIKTCRQKAFRFDFAVLFATGTTFALIIAVDVFVFRRYSGDVIFWYYFAYLYPYLIAEMLVLQFASMVKTLQIRFATINESLKNSLDSYEDSLVHEDHLQMRAIEDIQKQSAVFTFTNNKNQILDSQNSVDNSNGKSYDRHEHFQVLFELHDKLLDTAEKVNISYSFSAIAFIAGSFILVLFAMLFEAKIVFNNGKKDFNLLLIASSYLLWSIQCILAILLLLCLCEKTRQEAYETPIIVHKILQKKPKFIQQNDVYYNKMKSFMIQMLHRKKVFNFSGSGLFNFDYTFIFSVVSAATSYLIVLLQFDVQFETSG